jgi:hypothetical protein
VTYGIPGDVINYTEFVYIFLSLHQNTGQYNDVKIGNRSFESVAQSKYLATTITNQNLIQEEIKRRLNSLNACYHSIQNIVSSLMQSKNVKIRIYCDVLPGKGQ